MALTHELLRAVQWFARLEANDEARRKLQAESGGTLVGKEDYDKSSGKSNRLKKCPNPACGVLTEKLSGCMFMTCTQCREVWCWQCGQWGKETHHVRWMAAL